MNETEFWDAAYRENAPALLGVLRRYVADMNVAQDLLHEVFITAINKYGSYTGKGAFGGWLHRIAVNTALMYLRGERNRQVPAEAVLSVMDGDESADGQADDARTVIEAAGFSGEELLAAIDRLPEHHKLVFNMYVMDDYSHKQIGTELDISPGTSKSHLARARKKIQQFLYDDALKKSKFKDRKRASAAALLLFPAKNHFIDQLYRARLSDYTIPPGGGSEFLSAALEQNAASAISQAAVSATQTAASTVATVAPAVPTAVFWGSKLSYVVLCCGTAAVTGSACWLSMGDNSPLNRNDSAPPAADVIMYSPKGTVIDSTAFDASGDDRFALPGPVSAVEPGAVVPGREETNRRDEPATGAGIKTEVPQPEQEPEITKAVEPGTDVKPAPASGPTGGHATADTTGNTSGPVVVRKQIIQRETVVVRDTIVVQE